MGQQGLAALKIPANIPPDAPGGARGEGRIAEENTLAVRRLTLTDFRCYHHQRIDIDANGGSGIVVLTGDNGAGKTNVLEALSFLVPGRGLRRAKLSEIIRLRQEGAGLSPWGVAATVATPSGAVDIGTGFQAGVSGARDKRVVRIDGETMKSQAALGGYISAQWLTPQMDRLFLEGPLPRRRFFDRLVFDSDPAHLGRFNAYEHAMRERMRLLRSGRGDIKWIGALEDTMATKGVAVAAARLDVVRRLGRHLSDNAGAFPKASADVAGEIEDWLGDGPALAAEDRFREALKANRSSDAQEGRSAIGVHKSDFLVHHLGNGQAAALCSTGEQKALLIALVLAAARMRAEELGTAPLLLLDEVAAHLDNTRREALFDEISDLGAQVWLTGTDQGLFSPLAERGQFFNVCEG
ncbi:MAG: DNA replication/repair protein RecF, partial [Rhodospirillales bacterium]